tara:strand:+ start:665 stop:1060 length:396 start_codon:yes stop_codon:yes gene_type:complete
MPNWCYNRVEIYGADAEKIADKIASEETPFDFAKIVPEPDYDKIEVEPTFENEDSDFRMPTWWDWRVQNWGTKWNSSECEVTIMDDEQVEYTFNTAWGPPEPIIHKLRELYPDVSITAFYDEPGMELAGYI